MAVLLHDEVLFVRELDLHFEVLLLADLLLIVPDLGRAVKALHFDEDLDVLFPVDDDLSNVSVRPEDLHHVLDSHLSCAADESDEEDLRREVQVQWDFVYSHHIERLVLQHDLGGREVAGQ